jgi:polyribonucleotide nucleotidyltransferase
MNQEIIHPFGGKTQVFKTEFCGKELEITTGNVAFLADGAVMVKYGDIVVMGTAVVSNQPRDGIDYFPLMVDYEERMYAAGKISGSRFMKREGRASEHGTLSSRLIDRPIRPLFPNGYRNDIQAIATVLSVDHIYAANIIGIIAVSAALMISGAPFEGPVCGVRVGLVDGKLVIYPTEEQMLESKLDLVVVGTKDAIMMVEAGASEVDEETMVQAIEMAHEAMQPVIKLQEEIVAALGAKEKPFQLIETDKELIAKIQKFLDGKLIPALRHKDHYVHINHEALRTLGEEVVAEFGEEYPNHGALKSTYYEVIDIEVRRGILEDGVRPDGRVPDEIRPLSHQVGFLPRAHGSALFTRGITQVLNTTTLASTSYAQMIDTMEEDTTKRYMHHYNFPPYATGDVRPMRSPGRREIGHGALAERALLSVLPSLEDFPYTIRTVSEAITSNGSTSMASVCGSTMSLMDAGVPLSAPVAGIAMGLMMGEDGHFVVLSDVAGSEDHGGDMDFKVAGSATGVTALQMDIKIKGITPAVMREALIKAKAGRIKILDSMLAVIPEPRAEMSPFAPRIYKVMISPDKIKDVIGKGGEMINKIIAETGVEIDIEDSGLVMIAATNAESAKAAIQQIEWITAEPEVGKVYEGKVVKIMEFGAFVNIMPGKDGLVHISQLAQHRVEKVEDEVSLGDTIRVKLTDIDDRGRLVLSKTAAESDRG